MEAALAANFDAVQVLVWQGADVAAVDQSESSALAIARLARADPQAAPASVQRLDEIIVFLGKNPGRKR